VAAYEGPSSSTRPPQPVRRSWTTQCRSAVLHGHPAEVLWACDRGVELARRYPGLLVSRALARALTGELAGALADLEEAPAAGWMEDRARTAGGIEALRRGENPFTPEVLGSLRGR